MNTMKSADWYGLATYLASGGAATYLALLGQALPNETKALTIAGITVVFISGLVVRLWNNKTDAPATSIVANAPIVSPTTDTIIGTNTHTPSGGS